MRAVVTGAGGFVGANLVQHLLAGGHEPVAVVRPRGDRWRLDGVDSAIELLELDLADPDAIARAIPACRPEVIFHLAAHGAYSWQQDLATMLSINVRATEALLQVAESAGATLVHAGSSSEYGYQDHPPREDEPVSPNSLYAVTKVAATHLCRLAAARGARAVTLRLYSIYGPWEQPGRLLPTLVRHCMDGSWPPLVAPDTARDFVWIADACDAFVRAADAELGDPGAVFNIASGTQTTLAALVEEAQAVFEVEEPPRWGSMEGRAWDTSSWVGDPGSAARELGWRAQTSIGSGLQRLASWMRDNPTLAERYAG